MNEIELYCTTEEYENYQMIYNIIRPSYVKTDFNGDMIKIKLKLSDKDILCISETKNNLDFLIKLIHKSLPQIN